MTAGYQPDPVAEHAAQTELAHALGKWQQAEHEARLTAELALDRGVRSSVVADALGMSRSTLYRWLQTTHDD